MIFKVTLREGSNGNCRPGFAMTFADSPDPSKAAIEVKGELLLPTNGLTVIVYPSITVRQAWELLKAGYAVQCRELPLRRTVLPPMEDPAEDPEDIQLD